MRAVVLVLVTLLAGCASLWRDGFAAIVGSGATRQSSVRDQALAHFLAATLYEKQAQLDKALEEMRKAADLAPESLTPNLRLIRAYLRSQDYQNALVVAQRATGQTPNNANLWVVLGEIHHQLNQYDEAVASFQKAIELDPENVLGYGALVSVQEGANDLVAAVDIYQRLAKLTPNAPGIHFQLGLSLARINDAPGARAALQRALELNPDLARARFMLGLILLDAGENQAAEGQLGKYLESSPDDSRARENHAAALVRLKRYPEAIEELNRIINGKNPEPRHGVERMYVLIRAGQFRDADAALPADGAPIFGAFLRGLARKGMGEPYRPVLESIDAIEGDIDAECTAFLNEILSLYDKSDAGEFFRATLNELRAEGLQSKFLDVILARTLTSLDRFEDAEKILTAALDRFGSDKTIHYCLAVVYDKLKRLPETEKQLKECLTLKPDDPELLNFLGYLYAEHNMKLDEAEALLHRALQIQPGNSFYLDSLGWVYYRKGDAGRAIELIRKAILAMDSDDAELRDHLGDAYLLKGDTARAVAEWQRAIRLNPKLDRVKEKLDKHQK